MNRIEEIRELYAFDRWAHDRILELADALSPEELERDLGSSFSSVRETLVHLLESETAWVWRWRGAEFPGLPEGWDLISVDGLRDAWRETRARQDEFLARLSEDDLERRIEYTSRKGDVFSPRLRHMLRHVVNHSSYHRGQVVTMLRQLGHPAASTDLMQFYREKGGG